MEKSYSFTNYKVRANDFITETKKFIEVINRHNILSFSASLSYYAALALAPFLLILLKIGSILGRDAQDELIFQAEFILGEDVGKMIQIIFSNIKVGINLASVSGIIGVIFLFITASVVFLQLRFILDTISGDYNPDARISFMSVIKERLFIMGVVLGTALLFFLSLFISNIVNFFAGDQMADHAWGKILLILLNVLMNYCLFSAIYYFIPTNRPKLNHASRMALFTSFFFLLGKYLIGYYLENIASDSVYGAAGALLVFLVWAYYSSFIIFLSMELFLFYESKKIKALP
jgi:membrane protein